MAPENSKEAFNGAIVVVLQKGLGGGPVPCPESGKLVKR